LLEGWEIFQLCLFKKNDTNCLLTLYGMKVNGSIVPPLEFSLSYLARIFYNVFK
jgi:hypothetical protein